MSFKLDNSSRYCFVVIYMIHYTHLDGAITASVVLGDRSKPILVDSVHPDCNQAGPKANLIQTGCPD